MLSINSVPSIEGKKSHYSVIVVGAGQAGLSMSYCLQQQSIDHLVLERSSSAASNWKTERWDSFCLVTPNWQCQLPGFHYTGEDPNGFMVKEQIIEYLNQYTRFVNPPVKYHCDVKKIVKLNNVFRVFSQQGVYSADNIVIATGAYHIPNILPTAKQMPEYITHVHSKNYKNADQLPEGEVMVVGTGQSGCQIAEDLHISGRKVHLCVGAAPRVNRRYRGRDVVAWLDDMGYYQTTIENHPDGENAPHSTNHYVTGRDGGRDINLRIFAEQGMQLYGKLNNVEDGVASFLPDLKINLDHADDVAKRIRDWIEAYIQTEGIDAPLDENIHSDFIPDSPLSFDMNKSNIHSVVWATGFKTNFSWIDVPVFNEHGFPQQHRGLTNVNGMYFLGLNWMHTWGSGRFFHVGKDAEYLANDIVKKKESIKLMA